VPPWWGPPGRAGPPWGRPPPQARLRPLRHHRLRRRPPPAPARPRQQADLRHHARRFHLRRGGLPGRRRRLLVKRCAARELVQAIRAVLAGRPYITPLVAAEGPARTPGECGRLTPR